MGVEFNLWKILLNLIEAWSNWSQSGSLQNFNKQVVKEMASVYVREASN